MQNLLKCQPWSACLSQSTLLPCVEHKQLPPRDWLQLFKGVSRSQPRVKQIQSAQIQQMLCSEQELWNEPNAIIPLQHAHTHVKPEHVAYAKSILC